MRKEQDYVLPRDATQYAELGIAMASRPFVRPSNTSRRVLF